MFAAIERQNPLLQGLEPVPEGCDEVDLSVPLVAECRKGETGADSDGEDCDDGRYGGAPLLVVVELLLPHWAGPKQTHATRPRLSRKRCRVHLRAAVMPKRTSSCWERALMVW